MSTPLPIDLPKFEHLRADSAVRRILEARARALAAQETSADSDLGEESLVFRLGGDRYRLPVRCIREVQPFAAYTRLPGTPSFVVGLVNMRGRLLTVLDIRPLLNLTPAPPQPGASLLILSAGGVDIGLLADTVIEVRRGDDDLTPALSATAGAASMVRGVDRHLNLVIDPMALVTDPRLAVNTMPER